MTAGSRSPAGDHAQRAQHPKPGRFSKPIRSPGTTGFRTWIEMAAKLF
jgi:hypothetical protein